MIPQEDYDLSEELTRKSGEALSWLENEFERGAMSPNAYFMALMAVDMVTLGLIPDEYSKWTGDRRKQIGVGDSDSQAAFVTPGQPLFAVVRLDREKSLVEVAVFKNGKRSGNCYDMSQETDPTRAAYEKFQAVCKFLVSKGYQEVA